MPRPKGSKNKQPTEEVKEKLFTEITEVEKEEDLLEPPKEKRIFLGYHPITGAEVWH